MQELLRPEPSVHIIGIDNTNDYYDVSIKEYRLQQIEDLALQHLESTWTFVKGSIADDKVDNPVSLEIFNYGNCKRDFTYVEDIVEGVKQTRNRKRIWNFKI